MMSKIIFNLFKTHRPSDSRKRYIKKVDENNDTINIGSLYLNYNDFHKNDKIYENLLPNEVIQCKEFINTYNKMRRCKSSTSNDSFKAQTIYWDSDFANMLYEIAEYAQSQGVNFMPKDYMFEAILGKLESLNKQIDLSEIFNKYQFRPTYKGHMLNISNNQRQAVISDFLRLNDDHDQLMTAFNDHIHDCYSIDKQFTYNMLQELTENHKDRAIRSYVMSACIDMLLGYGINPCVSHNAGLVFYYWYSVRTEQYNAYDAIKKFTQQVEVSEDQMNQVYLALTDLISKPILPNHVKIKN